VLRWIVVGQQKRDGALAFAHACRMRLEGIVAKRDRPHRSGRTTEWIKVKNPDARAASRACRERNRSKHTAARYDDTDACSFPRRYHPIASERWHDTCGNAR